MTGRARANGEGSIFPYRNGFAAYAWVDTPAGLRKRKYVYGRTREDVHHKWLDLQQRAKRGPVATKVPTVEAFLTRWLEEVIRPNRAPLTYATYETLCRLHIVPELGKQRIDKLSPRDVQVWLNRMQVKCQCCAQELDAKRPEQKRRCCAVGKCCQKRLGARSIKDLKTVLRSALTHAVREDLATRNVAESTTLPPMRAKKRKAWTSDEARHFLESAREAGDPLYAAFVLILVLGFRKGEVLGLAWDEVDFDNRRLMIEWQVQRVGRELLRRQTKTETSDAGLPLPDICIAALRDRQIRQQEQRAAAGRGWEAVENLVFTRDCGSAIEPRTFNRQFSARCRKAGVRRITVHDARRTCATLLVDLDVHPRIVMEILRHAQIEVTMEIYAQASSPATQDALRRLGEQLSSTAPELKPNGDPKSA